MRSDSYNNRIKHHADISSSLFNCRQRSISTIRSLLCVLPQSGAKTDTLLFAAAVSRYGTVAAALAAAMSG